MRNLLSSLTAMALISTLTACGGREEAANNVTAENDMNAMMADSGPFADAEMRMNDAMMAAVGVNAGDSWVRKMIEHHRGAVDMSRIVLEQNPSADVATMARDVIAKQTKEIAVLEKLVQQGSPDQQSAALYRPAMMDMQQKMAAAEGADASEIYMRKMLEHHRGAVAMSDVALANGASGAVRTQVEKTKATQRKDAEMVEAMLRGEPMKQQMAESDAKPAPAGKPATERPAAAPAKPAAPKPDPHAGMDMGNMDMNKM